MAAAARALDPAPHIPVLLEPLLEACAPIGGFWIDGTLGAGGYARGLLDAGADRIVAIDRDPSALALVASRAADYGERLRLIEGTFGELNVLAGGAADGVVLDLGVSSMQIDQAERGFSFMVNGPLDMRMGQSGRSAADIVNEAPEEELADILYHFGEERAARRIARAIVDARGEGSITTTGQLAEIVKSKLPRPKPGQSHAATRSFQALRIAVNDELGELVRGLSAAERVLKPGGKLAVVSFHSLEDRIVKRFMAERSDVGGGGNRFRPERPVGRPAFDKPMKAVGPTPAEIAANPRARSARLRVAVRTEAPAGEVDASDLGVPRVPPTRRGQR